MDNIVEQLHSLLFSSLVTTSPVLSGNMKASITQEINDDHNRTIIIDAPFYNMEKWKKEKVIIHTGESKNGKTAYAYDVNKYGAFFTHNASEGWVNRAILDVVNTIASQIGAEVINDIQL